MAEYTSLKQSNTGWNLTWSALGRYPMVAKRRFPTLADAQAFVDDVTAGASATEGLIVTVLNDSTPKNNGVWYVKSVANTDAAYGAIAAKGELIKVGGTETETAKNYSAAVELSKTLTVGQLIKVSEQETITTGEGESAVSNTYKAGFYIVEGSGVISALDTSTGAADEIGALKTRVTALETSRVKNSDFETYKSEVSGALDTKAAATDLSTHTSNANIHVTADDKAKWNNAEENAKSFTTDEIAKLSTVYDAKGAAGEALTAANKYTDEEVAKAKSHADGLNTAMNNRVEALESVKDDYKAYTDQAELDAIAAAKSHADGLNTAMNARVEALESVKDDYKAYADQAELDAVATAKSHADGLNTVMNARVEVLEAIDHDKLAENAAASAVATILDGAPEKFDTLKEIAEWIADADTADDAASLVTRVGALEAIDHDAYVKADETNLAAAKAYADQAELDAIAAAKSETESQVSALANGAVKANADAIAIINSTDASVEGSIAKAKADAIAAALAKIAELDVANTYETKSDAAAKLEAAKKYTDVREVEINKTVVAAEAAAKAYTDEVAGVYSSEGVEASGLRKEIEDNEKVTAAALTELDGRVDVLEARDVYVAKDVADAIDTAQAAAEAFATTYTNALFDSIKFASEDDIDGLFAVAE